MNGEVRVRGKALAGAFTTCMLLASLLVFAKGAPAEAHAPGGQRVDLTPVVIYDGDMRREIHESLTIAVSEDVFPAGFLELQKKALFGIPERATVLELEREGVLHTQVTEQFLASPAWQLFEGAKMPYPWVGGIVAFGLLLMVAAVVYTRLLKKYRAGCARQ